MAGNGGQGDVARGFWVQRRESAGPARTEERGSFLERGSFFSFLPLLWRWLKLQCICPHPWMMATIAASGEIQVVAYICQGPTGSGWPEKQRAKNENQSEGDSGPSIFDLGNISQWSLSRSLKYQTMKRVTKPVLAAPSLSCPFLWPFRSRKWKGRCVRLISR